MSQSSVPQHRLHERDNDPTRCSCSSSSSSDFTPRATPTTNQQQIRSLRDQRQLQMLQQQQEQLRFLEEQLRFATIEDVPSRSSPKLRQHSTSSRRRSARVAFCEDVFCYTNPRDYDEIMSSWYSVRKFVVLTDSAVMPASSS